MLRGRAAERQVRAGDVAAAGLGTALPIAGGTVIS